MSPIQFPGNAEWGATSQVEALRKASDDNIKPLAFRVYFAAEACSNRIGHACFAPRGLAKLLSSVNRETGEVVVPTPRGVNKAIRSAKAMGLIADESFARCLVLHRHGWQKDGKGNAVCSLHDANVKGSEWVGAVR